MIPEYRYDWSDARKRGVEDDDAGFDYLKLVALEEDSQAEIVADEHVAFRGYSIKIDDIFHAFGIHKDNTSDLESIAKF